MFMLAPTEDRKIEESSLNGGSRAGGVGEIYILEEDLGRDRGGYQCFTR